MSELQTRKKLHRTNLILIIYSSIFLVIWQMPPLDFLNDIILMSLPTHIFLETISIIISMMIFSLVFSISYKKSSGSILILACAFFSIGLLDFVHTLSFPGMPDFITPASFDKTLYFWLNARYIMAFSILFIAIMLSKEILLAVSRYWLFSITLLLTGIIVWAGLFHLEVFPRTFIPGKGLTTFKIAAEYGINIILLIAAFLFYLAAGKQGRSINAVDLYAASSITILSELCFTLYGSDGDMFILLGHIYKVIAYMYIFRAIFIFFVREPYIKLQESERYNRSLLESSTIGLALCRMDGSLVDINQAYADILGRNIDETKQLSYWQITPEEYMENEQLRLEELNKNLRYGPYQKEYIHKDGHRVPVRLNGKIIEKDGEQFIWSSVENITIELETERARYESEQNFRQLVANIKEVFWLSDVHKNAMIYISPSYENIWGRTCQSLYDNPISFIEAIHEDDRERVLTSIMKQKEGPYYEEYRILRPDGKIRWIRDRSFPIKDSNDNIYRVAGVADDITEQKMSKELLEQRVEDRTRILREKETELTIAKESAERANMAKSKFLSSMSHELRTPLNAILGFSQLLEIDDTLDDNQKDSINEILGAGQHLLELVNQVLDLAKIETGHMEILMEGVEISSLIKDCVSLTLPLREKANLSIDVDLSSYIDTLVNADKLRLKQVLLNLLSNAHKYNKDNGEIKIYCSAPVKDKLRIYIQDTGNGISKENLVNIFTPFDRLGAENSGIEGTGIGLSITKQLISMMDGEIGVDSELGKGTTFWIELSITES